jgi:site-specific DNA recombinase
VVVRRRVWSSKAELLAGGGEVEALAYQRASADKKQQGKSVGDQATLNRREVAAQRWRLGASYTDNDRSASRYAKRSRQDYGVSPAVAVAPDVFTRGCRPIVRTR